ncbi:MAG: P-type conjugative transfer protein TrbJ [Legionella sp.]|nr:MAG: P-type conjugative transfer protein TrbJ [Legionella sp.]
MLFMQKALALMPVFDSANLLESVKQTAYQIKLYKSQLTEYETMLKNTSSLASYNWDSTNVTIDNLLQSIDTLNYYKQQAGSLDAYLNRYQSAEYYDRSLCSPGGCTKAQLQLLRNNQLAASTAQKKANDAQLRGLDKQQQSLQQEAQKLRVLQRQAENAEGQKQAIQAASQLASAETNQLLQIRGLLIAEHNATATRAASRANKEAIQTAGDERFRAGSFKKSSGRTW